MVKILAILQLTQGVHIISYLYDKFVFNGEHCLRLTVKICQFLHLTGTFFKAVLQLSVIPIETLCKVKVLNSVEVFSYIDHDNEFQRDPN